MERSEYGHQLFSVEHLIREPSQQKKGVRHGALSPGGTWLCVNATAVPTLEIQAVATPSDCSAKQGAEKRTRGCQISWGRSVRSRSMCFKVLKTNEGF